METKETYNEQNLLLQISEGNHHAFAEVFHHYRNKVFTIALKLSGNVELAEEIVQDVFMKIWLKKEKLPDIKDFDAFLFIVTRNHSFNCLKKQARGEFAVDEPERFFPVDPDNPEHLLLEKEFLRVLNESINRLPAQQRQAWKLVKEQGMSRQQAAEAMGISLNTVKEHLKRAQFSVRAYSIARLDPDLFLILLLIYFS